MAFDQMFPWNWSRKPTSVTNEADMACPITRMKAEMNKMFDGLRDGLAMTPWGETFGLEFTPRLEMLDTPDAICITAELPGMEMSDIELSLSGQTLRLSGEKKKETCCEEAGVCSSERSYGSFSREVRLPCKVVDTDTEATFKNGVLKICLPKTPEDKTQAKTIPIKPAE